MNTLHICPPYLCSHFTLENPKNVIVQHYYSYTSDYFALPQKKTNSNCCTAVLAAYLLLFSASYYLHSPNTASGARYRRSACIGYVKACGSGLLRQGLNFSTAQCTYYATDQCRKRLEACISAEGGHSEHCLPDIPVATHHNRFFSEPPTTTHNWLFSESPTFERTQQTFCQMKKFCNSQVSVVGWASGLQFVFF